MKSRITIFVLLLCLVVEFAHGSVARSRGGMVATGHAIATEKAVEVLEAGGNAIDAAIAAAIMLGVVDGSNSGVGGGCFMLIHLADGSIVAIDGRETAPAGASPELYFRDGKPDTRLSQVGALASGTPGALAAYQYAVSQFGTKEFAELLRTGANLAEQGFVLERRYVRRLEEARNDLARFPTSKEIFLGPDGKSWPAGHLLVQQDLARTYRAIAEHGVEWFYNGPFAQAVEQWMSANGGVLRASDFAEYRIKQREPIVSSYRGYTIVGFPPPSSGGLHVAQILTMLELFDLHEKEQRNPADRIHVITEVMKLAFADRARWLGDPDFVAVPKGLLDAEYLTDRARLIALDRASEVTHGDPPGAEQEVFGKHTTHIAAADTEGNFVALTTTLNTGFGSKVVIPGTGVMMNNQLDDFSLHPDAPNYFGLVGSDANLIAPGKRPLSSMSPTIVLKDGRPVMTVGAAGGPRIITQVVLAITNHIDLRDSPEQALARPRFHHQWRPDQLWIERTVSEKIRRELESRGHKLNAVAPSGATQAIFRTDDGEFVGVADPRLNGKAAGP